jgi:cytochrome c oxidase subunit IV
MSDHHSAEEVQKSVRRYMVVFGALIVGTIVTVAVNFIDFHSVALTVTVALVIASIKAFLVAGYFMHLMSEKKMIYAILAATAFFFVGLMYLTIWCLEKDSLIHIKNVT